MEKEVLIHVKGLHMMDTPEGDEPIEIVVPGEYYFRNGSHYLRYEEMLDEQGLLKEQDMQSTGQGQSDFPYRFYVSDLAEKFKGFANSILPFDVEKTQKIDIEKY